MTNIKVKIFKKTEREILEELINKFLGDNNIQAEDIISISFSNGAGYNSENTALIAYKTH